MVVLVVGSGGSVGAGGHEVPFIPVIPVGPVPVNPDTLAPDPVGFVPVQCVPVPVGPGPPVPVAGGTNPSIRNIKGNSLIDTLPMYK